MSQNYISSLPQAFAVIKEMNLSAEWDSDYRLAAREALVHIFEDRMEDRLEHYLQEMGRRLSDRRNGYFCWSNHAGCSRMFWFRLKAWSRFRSIKSSPPLL